MSFLHLGPTFALPDTAVTETFGILGQRGSGKSTAAVVMAEEMWTAGLPWVAVDPKGDWFGVRSSADGKSAGLALPVFGGLHGDLPLESTGGALVADLVVEQNLTAVLDVSDFTKADRARFLVAFFDRLYRNHRATPSPRHLFLEEAHEYIPQMVGREEGRLKEASARLILQGRTFGIGVTVCSQRSARLHKDVLTQVGTLIAMRTLAVQDRKAIEGWVTEHGVAKELLSSLPSLEPGEAWIWSPSYLGAVERMRFRRRSTFDSGATPVSGKSARPPSTLADVDLAAIKEAMAETIERAQLDDPKVLRRRIAQLEKDLAVMGSQPVKTVVEERTIEVPVPVPMLDEALVIRLEDALSPLAGLLGEVQEHLHWEVTQDGDKLHYQRALIDRNAAPGARATLDSRATTAVARATETATPAPPPRATDATRRTGDTTLRSGDNPSALPGPQRKLLTVLATYGPRTRTQLALQAGYSEGGGGFNNPLGSLRSAGYASKGQPGDPIEITTEGLAALGDYERLPSGRDLLDHWLGRVSGPEKKILRELATRWLQGDTQGCTKGDLAEATGYEPTGGGFNNPLGRLRTLGLVNRGALIALTDEFGDAIT